MQQHKHSSAQAEDSQPWYRLESTCIHCAKDDFSPEYGPRTLLECSCCGAGGTHVECFEHATGKEMTEDMLNSGSMWFCCQSCEEVSSYIESNIGVRMPVRGESAEYTLELVKYDKDSRGAKSTVDAAIRIFRESFDPLIMDNGQELVAMCCTSYESPDEGEHVENSDGEQEDAEGFNYSAFRVVALRKGNTIVSVATLRLFGTRLAEMPFVATKQGFRRAGHCRRLIKGVEDILRRLHVSWLVLPSIRSVLPMWRYNFNFMPLTLEEQSSLEPHIVSPDFDSAQLVKKRMWPPPAAAAGAGRRGRGRLAAATSSDATNCTPKTRGRPRGRGRSRGGGRAAAAAALDSDTQYTDEQPGSLRYSFRSRGKGHNRRRRYSAEDSGNSGADGDSAASDIEQDPVVAAEEAEAAAAWAAFEAKAGKMRMDSGEDDDSSSSSDDDDDVHNSGKGGRKRCRAGSRRKKSKDKDDDWQGDADDSSSSDSGVAELVPEDDNIGSLRQNKKHKQNQQLLFITTAAGSAADTTNSIPLSAAATPEEEAAALEQLRKDIAAAGGHLPETSWTVRLTGRQPGGTFKSRAFIELVTGKVHRSVLAVRRTLGLTPATAPTAGRQQGGAVGGLSVALKAWDIPPTAAAAAATGAVNGRKSRCTPSPAAILGAAVIGQGSAAAAAAAGAAAAQAPSNSHFTYDFSSAGYQKHQQRLAEQAALKRLRVGRAKRRMSREAFLGLCLADAIKRCYTAAAEQLATPGTSQKVTDSRVVAASLVETDVHATALVLDQQQQQMLRQQEVLQHHAEMLSQRQHELQEQERLLQERERQLTVKQQQLQTLLAQLDPTQFPAALLETGKLSSGTAPSAASPPPLADADAEAADCMLCDDYVDAIAQVHADNDVTAYAVCGAAAPSLPANRLHPVLPASKLQEHEAPESAPAAETANPVTVLISPTAAAAPARDTAAEQASSYIELGYAAAAQQQHPVSVVCGAAAAPTGSCSIAQPPQSVPASSACLTALAQAEDPSGPEHVNLQHPVNQPTAMSVPELRKHPYAAKTVRATAGLQVTAPGVAAAGGSGSSSGLTKSPRLSDSFLSGLLPQVVGQILVSPCTKLTAAGGAADMPSSSADSNQQLCPTAHRQQQEQLQHDSHFADAQQQREPTSPRVPATAAPAAAGDRALDVHLIPAESLGNGALSAQEQKQHLAAQHMHNESITHIPPSAPITTASSAEIQTSSHSSPEAPTTLCSLPLTNITAALNKAPSCCGQPSKISSGTDRTHNSMIPLVVCGVKVPITAQLVNAVTASQPYDKPDAVIAADAFEGRAPEVQQSLNMKAQHSRKRHEPDNTEPPATALPVAETQYVTLQASQQVPEEQLSPVALEHRAAVADTRATTKETWHVGSGSDKQLEPARKKKRPSAVVQCFGELAVLGGLTGLVSSSGSSVDLSSCKGSGVSSIAAGSGGSNSNTIGDCNSAASGKAVADMQCQILAALDPQSRLAVSDNTAIEALANVQVGNPVQGSVGDKRKQAPASTDVSITGQPAELDGAAAKTDLSAAAAVATKQSHPGTSKQNTRATGCSPSSDHTSTSDAGGLSGGLMDMFESVAADMVRDGMLPASDHDNSRRDPADLLEAVAADAAEALTAVDSGQQDAKPCAVGSDPSAVPAGVARNSTNVLTRLVLPPTGLNKSPTASSYELLLAKALPAWQSPAGNLQPVVVGKEPRTTAPTLAEAEAEAADTGIVWPAARSVTAEAADSDTHAALDTAALFAFAGDLDE